VSELTKLYEEIAGCQRCQMLAQTRTKTVPGEGPEHAEIMFIGEAPGFHEDRQGRPFVGAAGQFLNELLESIGMNRQDVYICNMLKCRPPQNRDPLPTELDNCRPYLDRQIALIKPKIILTLGRFAMSKFFTGAKISQIHGQPEKRDGIVYIPLFHPAAALHQPRYRSLIEEDFSHIPEILADFDELEAQDSHDDQAEQLSLF
jgi:DNA polymerase